MKTKNKPYRLKCKNCGFTYHTISQISRNKGVKLKCSLCNRETNWLNKQFKK
ncbi:hypothetical protein LCGC14_1139190 [marine sediment metagenome]|uniref:Zinc finger/thioredoxin putative domain-containing protein n=1 Tax=marine sediment metagenome TaxID=412755 RepID=A0A0F9PH05_9ZZZZ